MGRKKVRLADPKTVRQVTGYTAGTVPPFGHREPVETLIDPDVFAYAEVYAGGGEENSLLRISPDEIRRVSQGELLALRQDE